MSNDGWKAPQTDEDVWRWFSAKHGDDHYTREMDQRWRKLGRLIDKGSRIRDGYLGR
jgi:hypothetical protein